MALFYSSVSVSYDSDNMQSNSTVKPKHLTALNNFMYLVNICAFLTVTSWVQVSIRSQRSSFIQVLIRRRPLLYVVGLLIPSIFLMLVDVTSFYLPLNSGTRIVFKVSILLGYTVFRVNITEELPSTAVRTPLIGGIFYDFCVAVQPISGPSAVLQLRARMKKVLSQITDH